MSTTRPPEPLRPLPATRPGVGLLAARARRRRLGDRPPNASDPGA
ncbi:hypothetical protein BH18ACT1_BH18ACT1_08600 [soil metagenome]